MASIDRSLTIAGWSGQTSSDTISHHHLWGNWHCGIVINGRCVVLESPQLLSMRDGHCCHFLACSSAGFSDRLLDDKNSIKKNTLLNIAGEGSTLKGESICLFCFKGLGQRFREGPQRSWPLTFPFQW